MTTLTAAPTRADQDPGVMLAGLASARTCADDARDLAAAHALRARNLAYELHYTHKMSCVRIAEAVGCSVSTIERLVARARFDRTEQA